jgi:hypothetical protein
VCTLMLSGCVWGQGHNVLEVNNSVAGVQGRQAHVKHMQGKGGPGASGMNGHAVISVDTIYPSDLPQSMDDGVHYGSDKGAYALMATKQCSSVRMNGAEHHQEPVVDLSVPMHGQMYEYHQPGLGLSAPRQGGDIFDTWCASCLSFI